MRTLPICLLLVAAPLWAGEYAMLTTGFRVHAERHAVEGSQTILYDRDGGSLAFPTEQVAGFEAEDYVPPPPAPIATPPAPPVAKAPDMKALVDEAAHRHGVWPELVHSVIAAESAYNTKAVSPKGAVGLMQLMPETAGELQVSNPLDPAQNINGGTAYLRQLLERYAGSGNQVHQALAAYNAGPAKVDRYRGLPPYRETVDFVTRVVTQFNKLRAVQ
jgi:soluble lytic murein transglycosylase-like protein